MRVAFTSNDQLWLWQNGTAVFLSETSVNTSNYFVNTNLIAFSDGGMQIAFTKRDDEVWTIRTDGTGGGVVFNHAQLPNSLFEGGSETRPIQLDWLDDPSRLLLGRITWIDTGRYGVAPDLLVADVESGEINEILPSNSRVHYFLSPDKQNIAIAGSQQIEVANTDGSERRVLFSFPEASGYDSPFIPEIHWDADSESFAIVLPSSLSGPSLIGPAEVWQVRLDGQSTLMAEIDWLADQRYFLSFSSDLTQFSYKAASDGPPYGFEIYVYFVSDQESHSIYTDIVKTDYWLAKNVRWSQDGSRLMILSSEGENNLIVVDLGQQSTVTLMDNLHIFQADWLDSASILFVSDEGIHVWEMGQPDSVLLTEHEGWERFDAIDFWPPAEN